MLSRNLKIKAIQKELWSQTFHRGRFYAQQMTPRVSERVFNVNAFVARIRPWFNKFWKTKNDCIWALKLQINSSDNRVPVQKNKNIFEPIKIPTKIVIKSRNQKKTISTSWHWEIELAPKKELSCNFRSANCKPLPNNKGVNTPLKPQQW